MQICVHKLLPCLACHSLIGLQLGLETGLSQLLQALYVVFQEIEAIKSHSPLLCQ